jgi:hypothetical protein
VLDLCLHGWHNVYTGYQEPLNKGDTMLKEMSLAELECEQHLLNMDKPHSQILEGFWAGFTSYEIAEQLGEDPRYVACIMDTFRDLGY